MKERRCGVLQEEDKGVKVTEVGIGQGDTRSKRKGYASLETG